MSTSAQTWYKAKLLPAAQSIFTDSFYPEAKKTGTQYVWFTQVDPSPSHSKVLVASKLAEGYLRMITLELAKHCLEPKQKASKAEMDQLNALMLSLKDKI
jgi:hypothetical protein